MYKFKPSLKDEMNPGAKISPEAHKEWDDKEGKHSAMGMSKVSTDKYQNSKSVGPDGFDPGKRIKAREGVVKGKGQGDSHKTGGVSSSSEAATGHKTGPMTHAGKGAHEGGIKGPGGAGKINYGNGLKVGKKVPGLAKGKKA